jgi:chemotaxis protein CheD
MKRIVGIAEMIVSDDPEDVLITYALGPCLGVAICDMTAGVGGLIHCQLPTAKSDAARANACPTQFVDSGVMALIDRLFELGAAKQRLAVKVAGGAKVMDNLNVFQIAERNYTILRKLLWKNNLLIEAEEVGGSIPRTMSVHIGSGTVMILTAGSEHELRKGSGSSPAVRTSNTGGLLAASTA